MNMHEVPSSPAGAAELEPWMIVLQQDASTALALWKIADGGDSALAFFSERALAEAYARQHCKPPFQIVQFQHPDLVRVMVDGFRQGLRYAALNPGESTARQLFVLRDVLRAARAYLAEQ